MTESGIMIPLTNIEQVLPILDRIAIFGGLSEKELAVVFRKLKLADYGKGDVVFSPGETPRNIYIVKDGAIKLVATVNETNLELMMFTEGHCFGETAVIGIQPHSASAVAAEPSELIVLSREALIELHRDEPQIFTKMILNIAREACRRLHQTDEILLHYYLESIRKD